MSIKRALSAFGLDLKEVEVYLACLRLGVAPVKNISKQANFPRSTCYEILEKLRRRGLVTIVEKRGVKYFTIEDPQQLIETNKKTTELLTQSLPQLRALYKATPEEPTVRFYKGKLGMELVLEEVLKEARLLRSFGSVDDLPQILADAWDKFVQRRIQKKIMVRVILSDTPRAHERKETGKTQLRDVRIMSSNYKHHGLCFIWNHKIAMFSFEGDHVALVIESAILTTMQIAMFEALWDTLPA